MPALPALPVMPVMPSLSNSPVSPSPVRRVPFSPAPIPPGSTVSPAPTPAIRRRRIKAVGVELEGAWDREPPNGSHRDGSVTASGNVSGEVSSPPINTLPEVETWMRNNYPDYVNASCGLHVHVSVNELNYSRLMEPEFNTFFNGRLSEFLSEGLSRSAPGFELLRSRFNGDNQYCQKKFIPHAQLFLQDRYGNVNSHPRYAQLNFCYGRHGTLECRTFPCFPNPDDGVSAVKMFYSLVFDYLGQFKAGKDDAGTSIVIPLDNFKS